MNDVANKVATLMEAMPYLKKYAGKVIVIKYGGNAMINEELKAAVLQDVVMLKLLGMKPVLSHGGGPGINKMLEKLEIPVQFINGLRYTSEDIMRVVEAVLIGQVNSELVGRINAIGGEAVGLSGISANIYKCVQRSEELGFVGDVVEVNAAPVQAMLDAGYIPVVAPVGTDGKGSSFNINGDTAAGKLASALGAEKLMLLTDIEGLCNDIKLRDVISYLNIADVQGLKIRVPESQLYLDVWQALGATPVALALPELALALSNGTAEAQDNATYHLVANATYDDIKYFSNINYMWMGCTMAANANTWNGLDPAVQEILKEQAKAAAKYSFDTIAADNETATKTLQDAGVEFDFEPDVQSFKDALGGDAYYDQYKDESWYDQELLDAILAEVR